MTAHRGGLNYERGLAMRRFNAGVLILLAALARGLGIASDAPESGALPPDLRVYQVNKAVAEFPEEEDFSTPEAAYAVAQRVSAGGGGPADWARVSVQRKRAALLALPEGKQEVPPEIAQRRLNARILEVRLFRDRYAVVLAETRWKFDADPDERTVIDVRHLELEDGRWLNVGQDVVDSVERGRLIFARVCARHIGKPTRPKVDDPEASLGPFVDFLKMHGEDPKAFVMKALATHKVVIMGETHHRPRYWAFNASLVQDPEFAKHVGIIYLELPSNDQQLVDGFLAAQELDTTPVIEMLRNNLWMGWPDQPMLDFFVAVWRANQGLPPEERLRIVLADMQRPWKDIETREDWRKYNVDRDKFMAENILRDRREHPDETRNAFFIVGVAHTMLDLNLPTYPRMPDPIRSAGWHLQQALGRENVYAFFQHMPVQTNVGEVDGRLCLGLFDSAFAEIENRPVAFPLDTGPFGEQPFDAFPDRNVAGTYSDGYDAYLYLGPLEQEVFSPLIAGFYTDEFVQELERRTRIMWGKPWSEAYRQKPDAESFISWMRNSWGQPREWRRSLGPTNAWQYGDSWREEVAKQQCPYAFDHPEVIVEAAKNLLEAIRGADYDNPGDWREFPGGRSYRVQTNYPAWMRWICENFKRNAIQTIQLGEVSEGDGQTPYRITLKDGTVREGALSTVQGGLPTVPYKLTLADGTVLEGVLPFYYEAQAGVWSGDQGLDWHLLEPSLELSPVAKPSE